MRTLPLASTLAAIILGAALCSPAACTAQQPTPTTPTPASPTVPPASAQPAPVMALWITRFDYKSRADVVTAIDRAAELGMTDVLWQVRGQCDAYYRSSFEPWGEEILKGLPAGAKDPGFDPLAVAVERAHQRGLKLHAWVNIMPMWKGTKPPIDKSHPYHTHPEWRLRDASGTPQALNDHYIIVNPLLPAVHNHIVGICRELVTRYPIDGLHMDYVRFVSDTMKDPAAYPSDPRSIAIFEEATGRKFNSPDGKAAFREFKRDKITELVRRIKREAVSARPGGGVALTAAVWRNPSLARENYLQDAALWLKEGTLDRAFPMTYTKDDAQFAADVSQWMAAVPGTAISPGLGIYLHTPTGSGPQFNTLKTQHTAGFALFAYDSLYETSNPLQGKSAAQVAERAARLKAITSEVAGYKSSMAR